MNYLDRLDAATTALGEAKNKALTNALEAYKEATGLEVDLDTLDRTGGKIKGGGYEFIISVGGIEILLFAFKMDMDTGKLFVKDKVLI